MMTSLAMPSSRQTALAGTLDEPLEAKRLKFPEIIIFRAEARTDARGSVTPSFNALQLASLGINFTFYQENHCISPKRSTVRGFHYQLPPHGQSKLIRVTSGRILDVNVDIRQGSPTFGKHVAVELSATGWDQIYIPEGFAHCYCTLEHNCEVVFKLGHPFAPDHARGIAWNDPALGIDWPITPDEATVLQRDLDHPPFAELQDVFPYEPLDQEVSA